MQLAAIYTPNSSALFTALWGVLAILLVLWMLRRKNRKAREAKSSMQ